MSPKKRKTRTAAEEALDEVVALFHAKWGKPPRGKQKPVRGPEKGAPERSTATKTGE